MLFIPKTEYPTLESILKWYKRPYRVKEQETRNENRKLDMMGIL